MDLTTSVSLSKTSSGIFKTARALCVIPNGTLLLFDNEQHSFVQIDQSTGKNNIINTEQTKIVHRPFSVGGQCLQGITRGSKNFILALVSESYAKKLFIVTYLFSGNKITVVDEQYVSISINTSPSKNTDPTLFSVSDGQLYVISSYCRVRMTQLETIINLINIGINDEGKIFCKHLRDSLKIPGDLFLPFIFSGTSYWFRRDDTQDRSLEFLKVPLDDTQPIVVATINNFEDWEWSDFDNRISYRTPLRVVAGNIFNYAYNRKMNFGALLFFNFKEKRWRRVPVIMNDDHVIEHWPDLVRSENGSLFLHGECNLQNACEHKAHLYNIDAKKLFQEESNSSEGRQSSDPETLLAKFISLCLKWKIKCAETVQASKETISETCWMMILEIREDYSRLKQELDSVQSKLKTSQQEQLHLTQELHAAKELRMIQIQNIEQLVNARMAEMTKLSTYELEKDYASRPVAQRLTSKSTSRRLSDDEKSILTSNLTTLCTDLNPNGVLVALEENELFSGFDIQEIKAQTTKYDRNLCLIQTLKTRSSDALSLFIKALRETKQEPLADLLEENRQELYGNLRDTKVLPPSAERYLHRKTAEKHKKSVAEAKPTEGPLSRMKKSEFLANNYVLKTLREKNIFKTCLTLIVIIVAILIAQYFRTI